MKILVTGAAGFIGTHLIHALSKFNHDITAIDSLNDYYDVQLKIDRLTFNGIHKNGSGWVSTQKNIKFYPFSLTDDVALSQVFEAQKFTHVIHLAAQPGVRYSIENPRSYFDNNLNGFFNLLECIRHFGVEHFVYASSSSVYGQNSSIPFHESDPCNEPLNFYASTKKSNEMMAHSYSSIYQIAITGLRFFTVYGPWGRPDMAPMLFAKAAANNEDIKVFNFGNQKRDFTYIDDIVEGILRICFNDKRIAEKGHEVFNIGRGEPVGLMDFIDHLERAMEIPIKKKMVEAQAGETDITFASVEKLTAYTGYAPSISLSEGINKFVEWYKNYYQKK